MNVSNDMIQIVLDENLEIDQKLIYLLSKDKIIMKLLKMLDGLKLQTSGCVEWHSVSSVAEFTGISSDAVRKQLQNGDFEEGVDFKYKGARIQVNQGAIGRIQRKRRNSNG